MTPTGAQQERGPDWRQRSSSVRLELRQMILNGELPPGTVLSQVEMSARLGVSRTPLREALRALREEGLVEAETNRRARVAGFSGSDLDIVYARRVLLESLGIALTVPCVTDAELAEARVMLKEMRRLADTDDLAAWHLVHRSFHRLLVSHAHEQLRQSVVIYAERGERYVRLYQRGRPRAWSTIGNQEHEGLLDACEARDVDAATASIARHLARTALATMADFSHDSEPTATRAAVRLAVGTH